MRRMTARCLAMVLAAGSGAPLSAAPPDPSPEAERLEGYAEWRRLRLNYGGALKRGAGL